MMGGTLLLVLALSSAAIAAPNYSQRTQPVFDADTLGTGLPSNTFRTHAIGLDGDAALIRPATSSYRSGQTDYSQSIVPVSTAGSRSSSSSYQSSYSYGSGGVVQGVGSTGNQGLLTQNVEPIVYTPNSRESSRSFASHSSTYGASQKPISTSIHTDDFDDVGSSHSTLNSRPVSGGQSSRTVHQGQSSYGISRKPVVTSMIERDDVLEADGSRQSSRTVQSQSSTYTLRQKPIVTSVLVNDGDVTLPDVGSSHVTSNNRPVGSHQSSRTIESHSSTYGSSQKPIAPTFDDFDASEPGVGSSHSTLNTRPATGSQSSSTVQSEGSTYTRSQMRPSVHPNHGQTLSYGQTLETGLGSSRTTVNSRPVYSQQPSSNNYRQTSTYGSRNKPIVTSDDGQTLEPGVGSLHSTLDSHPTNGGQSSRTVESQSSTYSLSQKPVVTSGHVDDGQTLEPGVGSSHSALNNRPTSGRQSSRTVESQSSTYSLSQKPVVTSVHFDDGQTLEPDVGSSHSTLNTRPTTGRQSSRTVESQSSTYTLTHKPVVTSVHDRNDDILEPNVGILKPTLITRPVNSQQASRTSHTSTYGLSQKPVVTSVNFDTLEPDVGSLHSTSDNRPTSGRQSSRTVQSQSSTYSLSQKPTSVHFDDDDTLEPGLSSSHSTLNRGTSRTVQGSTYGRGDTIVASNTGRTYIPREKEPLAGSLHSGGSGGRTHSSSTYQSQSFVSGTGQTQELEPLILPSVPLSANHASSRDILTQSSSSRDGSRVRTNSQSGSLISGQSGHNLQPVDSGYGNRHRTQSSSTYQASRNYERDPLLQTSQHGGFDAATLEDFASRLGMDGTLGLGGTLGAGADGRQFSTFESRSWSMNNENGRCRSEGRASRVVNDNGQVTRQEFEDTPNANC